MLSKALKSCPMSNKSHNLVTLAIPRILLFTRYSWEWIRCWCNKNCPWLVSNCTLLILEATALPTVPHSFCLIMVLTTRLSQLDNWKSELSNLVSTFKRLPPYLSESRKTSFHYHQQEQYCDTLLHTRITKYNPVARSKISSLNQFNVVLEMKYYPVYCHYLEKIYHWKRLLCHCDVLRRIFKFKIYIYISAKSGGDILSLEGHRRRPAGGLTFGLRGHRAVPGLLASAATPSCQGDPGDHENEKQNFHLFGISFASKSKLKLTTTTESGAKRQHERERERANERDNSL